MKPIRLSADCPEHLCMVPDKVADNLRRYCFNFSNHWLLYSTNAEKYRTRSSYGEVLLGFGFDAFIEYLNFLYPDQPSTIVASMIEIRENSDMYYEYLQAPSLDF